MVTSGMSYAVHYELGGRPQDGMLRDFSRMRIDSSREQPMLYVAMATWIPKCNMYHHHHHHHRQHVDDNSQRAHRSRQYERGSSAERRYKRSNRRSPTSKKRHRHRHDRTLSRRKHSRRSYSTDQSSRAPSVEDDEEGHLIYRTGDTLQERCS